MRSSAASVAIRIVVATSCGYQTLASAQTPSGAEQTPTVGGEQAPTVQVPRRLSDTGELQRIISYYDGGKYEECTRELGVLLDPKNEQRLMNPQVLEQARLYHATCLVMSGREKEAITPLRAALSHNPTLGTPDALTFPPPLINLFLEVRKEFADAIRADEDKKLKALAREAEKTRAKERAERRRVAQLEQLATRETITERHSRFVASLPFGAGQFQNGDTGLGTVFLVSESLLLGTAVAMVGVVTEQYSHYDEQVFGNDIENNVRTARTVSIVTFYGFLGVAAVGIAEAHLNFVPELKFERRRELPAKLRANQLNPNAGRMSWLPWVEPSRTGVSAGIVGVF